MNTKNLCSEAIDAWQTAVEEADKKAIPIEQLLATYPDCSETLKQMHNTWLKLETITVPAPSTTMHAKFYQTLWEFEEAHTSIHSLKRASQQGLTRPFLRYAAVAAVFVVGLAIGIWISKDEVGFTPDNNTNQGLVAAQYIDLINHPSAFKRLEIVHQIRQSNRYDQALVQALNQTLLHDPNVNVRLAAVETIVQYADHPEMRELLLKAIPYQTEPLVLTTLAKVMIELQEKRAAEQFDRLLKNGEIDAEVQKDLREAMNVLM